MRRLPALLLAAALAAPARAARPLTPPAPDLPKGLAWLNSEELSIRQLRRHRVVLVTFMNVASMNSVRTFAALNAWWQRYSLSGLMIIGVHAPDFDFDRDPSVVKSALKRYNVSFPVAIDNDRLAWKAFENEGWPSMYLVDHKGLIVFDRLGEGGYSEFEGEIRQALERFNGYWAPDTLKPLEDPPAVDCGTATPAVYFGSRRGTALNINKSTERGRNIYGSRDGELVYRGPWTIEPDAIRLGRENPGLTAFARVIYQGASSHAVLGHGGTRALRMFLKQDDLWLHAGNAGVDVQWDNQDRSFVVVNETRVYNLTKNENDGSHELMLVPQDAGGAIFDFEFSNFCQAGRQKRL